MQGTDPAVDAPIQRIILPDARLESISAGAGAHAIRFEIKRQAGHAAGEAEVREKSTFVVPR